MKNTFLKTVLLGCSLSVAAAVPAFAESQKEVTLDARMAQPLTQTYEKLLPLEGGSNFRDIGGYRTADGKTVKRGVLFRSGNMANLTEDDMNYLNRFGFKAIVDLRSSEELDLYPNRWAKKENIEYYNRDYSIMAMMQKMMEQSGGEKPVYNPAQFYGYMPQQLAPQLTVYFDNLVQGKVPMIVNCSAGQDRTGIASAVLLSALGVPRETVINDYLLSTQYRRPAIEMGGVDLEEAAKTNGFAKMMLHYKDQMAEKPKPLITEDKTPYLAFALKAIDEQYGSVPAYLEKELGVSEKELAAIRNQYLN